MALTRKLLNSLKLEESVIESIIEAHSETVDALKKQRDDALASANAVEDLTRERDELKNQLEDLKGKGGDAAKVQADFDAYKAEVEAEKKAAKTETDVLELLKAAGIQRESFQRMASKAFDRNKIQRGEDGAISNRDELLSAIKAEFADCIAADPIPEGAPPVTPPSGGGKTYTRDQIRGMSADEINANWAAVSAALAK